MNYFNRFVITLLIVVITAFITVAYVTPALSQSAEELDKCKNISSWYSYIAESVDYVPAQMLAIQWVNQFPQIPFELAINQVFFVNSLVESGASPEDVGMLIYNTCLQQFPNV